MPCAILWRQSSDGIDLDHVRRISDPAAPLGMTFTQRHHRLAEASYRSVFRPSGGRDGLETVTISACASAQAKEVKPKEARDGAVRLVGRTTRAGSPPGQDTLRQRGALPTRRSKHATTARSRVKCGDKAKDLVPAPHFAHLAGSRRGCASRFIACHRRRRKRAAAMMVRCVRWSR